LIAGAEEMINLGMTVPAIDMVKSADERSGGSDIARTFLFEAFTEAGQTNKALAVLNQLVENLNKDRSNIDFLVEGYIRLNQHEQAIKLLENTRGAFGLDYDFQLRLARLYSATDQSRKALETWRVLWFSTSLPARRNFIEGHLLDVASEAGLLSQLKEQLFSETNERKSAVDRVRLLIKIFASEKDYDGAREQIETFAKEYSFTPVQKNLLTLETFQMEGDYKQQNSILNQLIEIDSGNARDYLMRLIIATVEELERNSASGISSGDIKQLVDRYAQAKEMPDTKHRLFLADIYARVGFDKEAIDVYAGLTEEGNMDTNAISLLANLLGQMGRDHEALSILSFSIEAADKNADLVTALDNLLNLISNETGVGSTNVSEDNLKTLRWAKRRIMERIIVSGEDPLLMTILGEVATLLKDKELQRRTLINALANTPEQRSYILREIWAMEAGNPLIPNFIPRNRNVDSIVNYGRRLLALGNYMPTRIYADLAEQLLDVGDTTGAEQAFSLIPYMEGLANIEQVKAETYLKAGIYSYATSGFNAALAKDINNFSLAEMFALLSEKKGDYVAAREIYLNYLLKLIRQQPVNWTLKGLDTSSVDVDFQRYYYSLQEGLIINWPDNASENAKYIEHLKGFFDEEISLALKGTEDTSIALDQLVRLSIALHLIRKISIGENIPELSLYADNQLSQIFANDLTYTSDTIRFYRTAGWENLLSTLPLSDTQNAQGRNVDDWWVRQYDTPSKNLSIFAQNRNNQGNLIGTVASSTPSADNFEREIIRALKAENSSALTQSIAKRLSQVGIYDVQNPVRDPYELFSNGIRLLDEKTFQTEVIDKVVELPNAEEIFYWLMRSRYPLFQAVQKIHSAELVSKKTLMQKLANVGGPSVYSLGARVSEDYLPYISQQTTLSEKIELIASLSRFESRQGTPELAWLLQEVLTEELPDESQDIIEKAFIAYSQRLLKKDATGSTSLLAFMFSPEINKQNHGLIEKLAKGLAEKRDSLSDLVQTLQLLHADKGFEALQSFVKFTKGTAADSLFEQTQWASRILNTTYRETKADLIRSSDDTLDHLELVYDVFEIDSGGFQYNADHNLRSLLASKMEALWLKKPKGHQVLRAVVSIYIATKDYKRLDSLLTKIPTDKDNKKAVGLLRYFVHHQISAENDFEEILSKYQLDIEDTENLVSVLQKAIANDQLVYAVFQDFSRVHPDHNLVLAYREKQTAQLPQQLIQDANMQTFKQALISGDDTGIRASLRWLWRVSGSSRPTLNTTQRTDFLSNITDTFKTQFDLPQGQGYPSSIFDFITVQSQVQKDRASDVMNAVNAETIGPLLVKWQGAYDEITKYTNGMPADAVDSISKLNSIQAEILDASKNLDQKFTILSEKLDANELSSRDLTHYLAIANKTNQTLSENQLGNLRNLLLSMPWLSTDQIQGAANIFGRNDDFELSQQLYVLLANRFYMEAKPGLSGLNNTEPARLYLTSVVSDLLSWADQRKAFDMFLEMVRVLSPNDQEKPEIKVLYFSFFIDAAMKMSDANTAHKALLEVDPRILDFDERYLDTPYYLKSYVKLMIGLGNYDQAYQKINLFLLRQNNSNAEGGFGDVFTGGFNFYDLMHTMRVRNLTGREEMSRIPSGNFSTIIRNWQIFLRADDGNTEEAWLLYLDNELKKDREKARGIDETNLLMSIVVAVRLHHIGFDEEARLAMENISGYMQSRTEHHDRGDWLLFAYASRAMKLRLSQDIREKLNQLQISYL